MAFRFLEHISDVYVEASGSSLEEAFVQGAYAIFETMTDIKALEARESREIKIEAEDLQALLFEWIDQFLYLFDTERLMFSKFKIKIEKIASGYRLEGMCWGEKFDSEKHPARTEIKAPTYSLMEIIQKPSKITLRFVMDI
jgi:SHS2 domain-containing protein